MKTVLHVGCGRKTLASDPMFKGWREVRFDIDESIKPDIIGTMTNLSAVGSGTMDAVYSCHNLEHVHLHEVPLVLLEFRRVLKESGFAVIIVPDLARAAELITQGKLHATAYDSPAGAVTAFDMVYGHAALSAESPFMAHKSGFTEETLAQWLRAAFGSVFVARHGFNVRAIAFPREMQEPEARSALAAITP